MEQDKNKKKVTEMYTEIQVLQQQLVNLEQQIKEIDKQEQELSIAVDAIKNLKKMEDNQELLIPMVNGVFIRAKILKSEHVLVNVGANTTVKKTVDETIEMLKQNISEVKSYKERIIIQYQNVISVLEQRQKSLTGEMNKQQKSE